MTRASLTYFSFNENKNMRSTTVETHSFSLAMNISNEKRRRWDSVTRKFTRMRCKPQVLLVLLP